MATNPQLLDQEIDRQRNNIRTDKLDITYGELASMYEDRELVITPEYQRFFRWSPTQKGAFIESILLGFPTPAIFVAETEEGIWELVDGLQRVSTIFEFMGVLRHPDGTGYSPSVIKMGDAKTRLSLLEDLTYEDLSLRSRLSIKRASCRVEVIKVGSMPSMKYEVFERLNTGGSGLRPQEIRNCIFRAVDSEFMDWIDRLSDLPFFKDNLGLSDSQYSSMYHRGLVMRFFALFNSFERFRHDVEPFITEYIRDVLEGKQAFDRAEQERIFRLTFESLANALGEDAWRHLYDGKYKGAFSVYLFEALGVGVARNIEEIKTLPTEGLRERSMRLKQHDDFRKNIGSGANTRVKLSNRIAIATQVLAGED